MFSDEAIRAVAFLRMKELTARHGGAVPWESLSDPITVASREVRIANRARGIFRPASMSRGVLSVKTTIPRAGRDQRYEDISSNEGFFVYCFQGKDPHNHDNRALRESFDDQSPLIYLHGVMPSMYVPIWPVFITQWDPGELSVRLTVGERSSAAPALSQSEDLRKYSTIQAKVRLHQALFREQVLNAYSGRCAISGLPERRLIQASHILPDRDQRGQPVVSNGIALSVLHHQAFDANLIGIDPDCVIHVNRDLLALHDGPTLQHALQNIHHRRIHLPANPKEQPDREFLAERFELFKSV